MGWKHDYLARANRIANTPHASIEFQKSWNALEDDIQGRLALWQCADLYDFVAAIPCQGSLVIMQMLPEDLPASDM